MDRPIAVINMDGVLVDFDRKYQAVSARISGSKPERLSDDYDFSSRYGHDSEHIGQVFKEMDWSLIPAYNDAKIAIDMLKDDYQIHICSAADPTLMDARVKCLCDHGIYFDKITLIGTQGEKQMHYKGVEIVVDDHENHIREAIKEGVPQIFMVDRNYSCMEKPDVAIIVPSILVAARFINDCNANINQGVNNGFWELGVVSRNASVRAA